MKYIVFIIVVVIIISGIFYWSQASSKPHLVPITPKPTLDLPQGGGSGVTANTTVSTTPGASTSTNAVPTTIPVPTAIVPVSQAPVVPTTMQSGTSNATSNGSQSTTGSLVTPSP